MATTAQTLIEDAYEEVGVKSPSTTELSQALKKLNNMLALWYADEIISSVVAYALGDTVDFPLEYIPALTLNLALEIAPYGHKVPDTLITRATRSKKIIKNKNIQPTEGVELEDGLVYQLET